LNDFVRLCQEVSYYGALNALAQLVMKITAPGLSDFCQGAELWDFRLVDPDNRGPVDFEKHSRLLAEFEQAEAHDHLNLIKKLLDGWPNGRIKLYVASKALGFRRAYPELFLEGAYNPLQVGDVLEENVFAFMRRTKQEWAVVALPRMATKLVPVGQTPTEKKFEDQTFWFCLGRCPMAGLTC